MSRRPRGRGRPAWATSADRSRGRWSTHYWLDAFVKGIFPEAKGKTAFANANEVKPLSPHDRLVIALHSPGGVAETGLCVCPPEKNARNLARDVRRTTFSGAF
jgi:hypothetical protein